MTIDWDSAPEGTTHRNQFKGVWIKLLNAGGGQYQAWINGCWEMGFGRMNNSYQQRPAQAVTEWTGEGLPSVGTVCEVLWNEGRMEYLRTKVFGVNEHGQPIHRFDEGPKKYEYQADVLVTTLGTKVFRPIRTAEQIAADEREQACRQICLDAGSPEQTRGQMETAYRLYDAGYRKQVAQ
ncbi:hypothetical protein [Pseudomonas syringae]|uniref:Uncharacterized protein n=1 Tax=Pseudomonas syringae CC1417 TaxID=1357272 RepID=A0AAU8LDZ0_PSESX